MTIEEINKKVYEIVKDKKNKLTLNKKYSSGNYHSFILEYLTQKKEECFITIEFFKRKDGFVLENVEVNVENIDSMTNQQKNKLINGFMKWFQSQFK